VLISVNAAPWKVVEEWKCSSETLCVSALDASVQFHGLASVPQRKYYLVPFVEETEWAPGLVWAISEEKYLSPLVGIKPQPSNPSL
jgi:hypothetical protein